MNLVVDHLRCKDNDVQRTIIFLVFLGDLY